MKKEKIENPQAFPCEAESCPRNVGRITERGMSLRDYFAAKAMQGLISSPCGLTTNTVAVAYSIADAMLGKRGNR